MDGHSHHDHKKRDFQVSKKGGSLHKGTGSGQKRGARGKDWLVERYSRSAVRICITAHVCMHLMNAVFRL